MTGKLFLALLLSLFASPARAETIVTPFFIELANIERLNCGNATGSGVRIDGALVLTAYHVVAHRTCTIDGMPVSVAHVDEKNDVAVVRTVYEEETRAPLTCGGFVAGKAYFAVGWARGRSLIVQRMTGTGDTAKAKGDFHGMAILRGLSFPGMSGGAIVDELGQLVGVVNAGNPYGHTLSRPLAQTYICGAK
jgi:S1-C subfamily serine protease